MLIIGPRQIPLLKPWSLSSHFPLITLMENGEISAVSQIVSLMWVLPSFILQHGKGEILIQVSPPTLCSSLHVKFMELTQRRRRCGLRRRVDRQMDGHIHAVK